MSRPAVNINKRGITPRTGIIEGRFDVKLKLKAVARGYIFTRNIHFDVPSYDKFMKILRELKKKPQIKEGDIDLLVDFYEKEMRKYREIQRVKEFAVLNSKKVIPGSSFKGTIRSRIEYKFKPYKIGDSYYSYSCFSVTGRPTTSPNHVIFWTEEVLLNRQSCKYDEEESPYVCIVCDMFGAPGLSSRYFFSDLVLEKGDVELLKDMNGIEAVKPNSIFSGEIVGINTNFVELGILFGGLELYSDIPVLIGAFKYQYIPKLKKSLFRNKFEFGTVKFELVDFEPKNIAKDVNEVISKARSELEKSEYKMDIELGKIT
jgi:RAMP superfamily.